MARKERLRERAIRGSRPWREEGERLKGWRKVMFPHLSFSEYAEKIHLNSHAYRQNENGKTRISVENALYLKAAYGISLEWIYAGDKIAMSFRQAQDLDEWLKTYRSKK